MEYLADHVRWLCRVPQVTIQIPEMTAYAASPLMPPPPPSTTSQVYVDAQDFAVEMLIEDWDEVQKNPALMEYYEDNAVRQLKPLVESHLQPLVDAGVINE